MTLLGTLSGAFATADRSLSLLRSGGLSAAAGAWLVPEPQNRPNRLSGESSPGVGRVITYAESVATIPVVFSVWSKLVRNLATTDLIVGRLDGSGTFVPDTASEGARSLRALLEQPAPGKGTVDLLQWLFNPYVVEGNSLLGKYRDPSDPKGPPVNLVPLSWPHMSALAVPGGPVDHWISWQTGEPVRLAPDAVVHLAWCSPSGSTVGTAPLTSLETSLRLDDSAARYQVASFDNASRPSGALVFPPDAKVPPAELAKMRESVEKQHGGVDNAFRIAVLTGGVDWRPMGFTAVEAELSGTRDRSREEVCIAFDVKPSVIFEPPGVPRDLADVLRDFERSLRPHTKLAEQVLQRQLIDPEPAWEGLTVRFDTSDLVRGTYREQVETSSYGFTNGLYALNEARKAIGLPPVDLPGANDPLVPHAQLNPGTDGRTLPPADPGEGNQARNRNGLT